jgi:hypothetical protein
MELEMQFYQIMTPICKKKSKFIFKLDDIIHWQLEGFYILTFLFICFFQNLWQCSVQLARDCLCFFSLRCLLGLFFFYGNKILQLWHSREGLIYCVPLFAVNLGRTNPVGINRVRTNPVVSFHCWLQLNKGKGFSMRWLIDQEFCLTSMFGTYLGSGTCLKPFWDCILYVADNFFDLATLPLIIYLPN